MGEKVYDIKKKILFKDNHSAINMEKYGKKSCTGNSRKIDIRYLFDNDKVGSKKMSIVYCSTEKMLAVFFTKTLQGDLIMNFSGVIMGWKHVDTLHMGPPSTKENAGNVVKISLNKDKL